MTQLTPTEIEALRIAIAEECGWKFFENDPDYEPYAMPPEGGRVAKRFMLNRIPPYTTSLDAIQAAAMERFKTPDEQARFENYLIVLKHEKGRLTPYNWRLTALDWSIAFARNAKIWRYKE